MVVGKGFGVRRDRRRSAHRGAVFETVPFAIDVQLGRFADAANEQADNITTIEGERRVGLEGCSD